MVTVNIIWKKFNKKILKIINLKCACVAAWVVGIQNTKVTFTKVSGYGEAYPGRSRDTVSCSTA
mgnify:FL=1